MAVSKKILEKTYTELSETFKAYEKKIVEKDQEVIDFKDKLSKMKEEELSKHSGDLEYLGFELVTLRNEALEVLRELLVYKDFYKRCGLTPPETDIVTLNNVNRSEVYSYVYDKEHETLEEKEKGIIQTKYRIAQNSEQYAQARRFLKKLVEEQETEDVEK